VLAVQNAVEYKDLGVATSGATLFRSIGGSVGTAILGSIFSNRLSSELTASLPHSGGGAAAAAASGLAHANPASLSKLPPVLHAAYIHSFTNALDTVFQVAAFVAAAAFLLSLVLPERPLRESVAAGSGIGESFAVPKDTDSLAEVSRSLGVLVGREGRRRLVEGIAERAGVDLSPAACWLLVRLNEDPDAHVAALCASFAIPVEFGQQALVELVEQGMVIEAAPREPGRPPLRTLTPDGQEAVQKLVAERRASLARLLDGWSPDQHADLANLLSRLAHELAREPSEELTVKV
jgi:DNA-binding MarR family transcriptional regulator